MVGKGTPVSEQKGLVTRNSTDVSTNVLADIESLIAQEDAEKLKNRPQPMELSAFANQLVSEAAKLNEDGKAKVALARYVRLIKKMGGQNESGETWRPQQIFIASKKSVKNADITALVGDGNMFFYSPGTPVPKEMRFFPLFITTNKKLFLEARPVCISKDGKTGKTLADIFPLRGLPPNQNYTAATEGSIHACGSDSCPNKPYMKKNRGETIGYTKNPEFFQAMGQECCGISKEIYLVDDQLQDIYTLDVKNQAIKKTAEPLGRTGFDPLKYNTWWDVSTYKESIKVNGMPNEFHYFKAEPTKLIIEPYLAKVIQQIVLHTTVLAERSAKDLETSGARAEDSIAKMESQNGGGVIDTNAEEAPYPDM